MNKLVAITAEWLVDSIDGVTSGGSISQQWVGLILLPIVGNAAGMYLSFFPSSKLMDRYRKEHVTAVTVSVKVGSIMHLISSLPQSRFKIFGKQDKLTLSLGVAVGSSIVSSSHKLHLGINI